MKQALRVAFGFNAVGGGAARRSTYRDHRVDSARPIGVVPFQWAGQGAAPEDVGGIVAADLRNSGKFNPLDRSSAAAADQCPKCSLLRSALGIDAVVVGGHAKSGWFLSGCVSTGGHRRSAGHNAGARFF